MRGSMGSPPFAAQVLALSKPEAQRGRVEGLALSEGLRG